MARLSIIIPGFNNLETYWRRCLDSVLLACGNDDEVICVDDGSYSRPGCLAEYASKDLRVKVVYLDKNRGQSFARNRGLELATGKWVTFVDSDDALYPEIYNQCFQQLTICAEPIDIILFGVRGVWIRERMTRFDAPRDAYLGILNARSIRQLYDSRLFEYPVNKIYRKKFLDEHAIRFCNDICPGEDTIFNLKCAINSARWATVSHVGYKYYRMDGTSLSRYCPNAAKSYEMKADAWQSFADKFGDEESKLSKFISFGEEDKIRITWDNMWRKGSPYSIQERWRYAKLNQRQLGKKAISIFGIAFLKMIVRRYFYYGWIYKIHIKKFYNDFTTLRAR